MTEEGESRNFKQLPNHVISTAACHGVAEGEAGSERRNLCDGLILLSGDLPRRIGIFRRDGNVIPETAVRCRSAGGSRDRPFGGETNSLPPIRLAQENADLSPFEKGHRVAGVILRDTIQGSGGVAGPSRRQVADAELEVPIEGLALEVPGVFERRDRRRGVAYRHFELTQPAPSRLPEIP